MRKTLGLLTGELGRIIIGVLLFLPAIILENLHFSVASLILYILSLLVAGASVFLSAFRGILRRDLLDEKFLMSIASIGAMILGEYSEGVAVMLFFLIGEYFEHKAVAKSRRSIRALMDIRPDEACVLKDDGEAIVSADEVYIGSLIIIRAGERVPIDAVVISGNADIDTSALTGESIPRAAFVGSEISSGTVVINGVLTARTIRMAEESASARVLDLVENANERKSKTEAFITKFAKCYTPFVALSAVLIAVVPSLFKLLLWREAISRALTFLVISCPCALVISVPMAFFGGIGAAASKGILYKGGNTFSALAKADTFAFDKTGTLTSGEFKVTKATPIGISRGELLTLAASAEYGSNHPIAECIKMSTDEKITPEEFTELVGRGISATVNSDSVMVGNALLMTDGGVDISGIKQEAGMIFVSKNGHLVGTLVISDKIKSEASKSISELRKLGVSKTVMLSGDRRENAERVADELSLDEVYSALLPDDKFKKLEELINHSRSTVYVGDGINDAPALALSDVGIAMGQIGSDSAIESADVVIMSDSLSRIPTAVKIARKTVRIAIENIVFALGVKGAILILGALGLANMWLAVFADVGVAVIAILNSMRTLRTKNV